MCQSCEIDPRGLKAVFTPQHIYFEKRAVDYPLGEALYSRFKLEGREIRFATSHNRITGIPGESTLERFQEAKKTLVVGVRRTLDFAGCKPSAHYQLPLTTGCPGRCQYCYLHSTLGSRPYLRLYVNTGEILQRAGQYIEKRLPEDTYFEGSATSDPLSVEHYSGSLARAITFFSKQQRGYFRFATKQVCVESLLGLEHGGKTHIRFSVNALSPALSYDQGVPAVARRIEAAAKMAGAGYPTGFLVAPVFLYVGWEKEYLALLEQIRRAWKTTASKDGQRMRRGQFKEDEQKRRYSPPSFEIIAHRFTLKARKKILSIEPHSGLPLDTEERVFKYGQFGYGKYIYPKEKYREIEELFRPAIGDMFPGSKVEYVV